MTLTTRNSPYEILKFSYHLSEYNFPLLFSTLKDNYSILDNNDNNLHTDIYVYLLTYGHTPTYRVMRYVDITKTILRIVLAPYI